jgi:regulator-associated protein of mTOR
MQVLLSQVHRLRALVLLGRFLDMGRWAADLALSVGIFPYVLKLLQTTAPDLRQTLVFIWTKILALDKTCQVSQLPFAMQALLLSRDVVLWKLQSAASLSG